nr:cytochrome P450 monooxygenase [Bemisia tabaci]
MFSLLNFLPSVTTVILTISSLSLYVIYFLKKRYTHWERRGVPHVRPIALFFGNTKDLALQRVPNAFVFQRIYNELEGHDFGGFYQMFKPAIMLRDPDLIRTVLIKNFSQFHDRFSIIDEKLDPLSNHLLNLAGQRWKNVRYKLTPTFSSGKLKSMQDLMQGCIHELADYLSRCVSDVQNLRELMAKFTTDVIGSCAFGLNCNSIRDENSEFRRIGRLIFKPSKRIRIRNMLRSLGPKLITLLRLKSVHPEVEDFFMSVLKEAVKYRESSALKRNDFLQLLINIQAEEKKQMESNGCHQSVTSNGVSNGIQNGNARTTTDNPKDILFTDSVVASNAFVFFVAGFETIAMTLSYCLYELALNPEICEKLKDEVDSVKEAHDGNLDFDSMKELEYMDAVLAETLRKYPPASILIRRCNEAFCVPGTSVVIEEGTGVYVPVYGLHHDPQFFPEPERFIPERFSQENKHTIVPGSYLPYGDGPRICIGMRFAQYEMKSVLSYLVSNFTFHPCEKTVVPLNYDPRSGLLTPLDGVWVRLQRRSNP